MPTTFDEEADAFLSQVGKPPAANSFDDEADALLASVGKTVPIKMTLGVHSPRSDYSLPPESENRRPSKLAYFGASAAQGVTNAARYIDQTVSDVLNGGDRADLIRSHLEDAGLFNPEAAQQQRQFSEENRLARLTEPVVQLPAPETRGEKLAAAGGNVAAMAGVLVPVEAALRRMGLPGMAASAVAGAGYTKAQGGSNTEAGKSASMFAALNALSQIPAAKYVSEFLQAISASRYAAPVGSAAGDALLLGAQSTAMGLPVSLDENADDVDKMVAWMLPLALGGPAASRRTYIELREATKVKIENAKTGADVATVLAESQNSIPSDVVLLTPETAVKFVAENPEAAAKLASVAERPSRKVFREAGFDGELSTAERDVFMQMVRTELGKKQAETQGLVDQQTQQATEKLNTEAPPPTPDAAEVSRINDLANQPEPKAATDEAVVKPEQDAKPAETTTPTKEATDGQEAQAQGRQEGLLTEQQKSEPPAPDTPAHGVPDGAFALKNEFTSQVRKDLGLNTLNSPERFTRQMAIDEAMKTGKVDQVDAIAQEVLQAPRALTPVETAAFDVRGARLSQSRRELVSKLKTLTDKTDIDATVAEIGRIEDSLDTLTMASTATGTESGRSLQARKNAFNYNADPVVVRARARLAKGGELTVPQAETLNGLSQRVEEATQRMTKIEERMKERNVAQVLSEVKERRKGETKQVKDMEMSDLMRRAKELLDGGCLDV